MHKITAINDGKSIIINDISSANSPKITGTINNEINTIDSMEFNIYPNNPGYKMMNPFHTIIESVNTDGSLEFYGRILKVNPCLTSNGELYNTVICEGYMAFLQDYSLGFKEYKGTVKEILAEVLYEYDNHVNRDWFGIYECCYDGKEVSIQSEGETAYEFIMNKIIAVYGGEIELNSMSNKPHSTIYKSFILNIKNNQDICSNEIKIGDNLISFSMDKDVTNLCTCVVPYGAKLYTDEDNLERLDITSVNDGKNWLAVDSEYGIIQRTILESEITDAEELKKAGQKYLEDHQFPKISYNIVAFDKHNVNPRIPKIALRKLHYVSVPILGIERTLLKVTKITMCIENPANDTFVIGTTLDTASSISNNSVTTADLNKVYDTINTNDTINAYQLNAINAAIGNLDVENLKAISADIQNLKADNARITTLIFGTAEGNYISVDFSDAVVSQISDGVITNAMIKSLAADKIVSGRLSTNLIDIGSDDGMFTIKDETLQIYDGQYVRVQIGKDADGDFNLVLMDSDGNLLWDAKGIGEAGIRNEIITDRMVSENANINGSKINLPSLIKEINESTETIKSSQITYDPDGQSLNISFNKIVSQLMDDLGYNIYPDSLTMENNWIYNGVWSWSTFDKYTVGTTSTPYAYLDSTFILSEGVIYTLSAWIKGRCFIYYPCTLESEDVFENYDDYTRVSYTFTYSPRRGKPVITSENGFSIYGIKCEYGGALTDWAQTAEEVNRASIIEMANVEVENENISFSLYKKDGLVEQMASLTIQANKIEATVTKINKDYVTSSQLTQTADSITSRVNAIAKDYVTSSQLKQTANNITSKVNAIAGDYVTSSQLKQTADSIGLKVLADGTVRSALTLDENGLEFEGNRAVFSGTLEGAGGIFSGVLIAAEGSYTFFDKLVGNSGAIRIIDDGENPASIGTPWIFDSKNGNWSIDSSGIATVKILMISRDGNYQNRAYAVTTGSDGKTIYFGSPSDRQGFTSAFRGDTVRIYSHKSGAVYLGSSGSTAVTSDENLKDLTEIDEKYDEFFKNLNPQLYVYKEKGHRKHIGFGARSVEKALRDAGLTTEEFAGVLKDTDVTISADEAGTKEDQHYDELYSLRYEEFIALNTWMIQKLLKKVSALEDKVADLERSGT